MIKSQLNNVDEELQRVTQEMFGLTREQVIKRSGELLTALKEATPVDTGRAKKSWRLRAPYERNGRVVIPIETLVDYMNYLNQGSSKQAPPFFIEATALRFGRPLGQIIDIKT